MGTRTNPLAACPRCGEAARGLCAWCRRDAEHLRRRAAEDEARAAELGVAGEAHLRTRAARRRRLADDIDGGRTV
jgi:hypothetical protein